jgi:hypothetical protein
VIEADSARAATFTKSGLSINVIRHNMPRRRANTENYFAVRSYR